VVAVRFGLVVPAKWFVQ